MFLIEIKNMLKNNLDKIYNYMFFKYHIPNSDYYPIVNGRIILVGHDRVNFKENVVINSGRLKNPLGGDFKTIFVTNDVGYICIGAKSGISNSTLISFGEGIEIGNNVLIGASTKIYDTDFHSLDMTIRNTSKDVGVTKKVVIKNNVFIGACCLILKGVTIGEGAIVGAGSVVTRDIPAREVWAGNPARFVKKIIDINYDLSDS